MKTETIIGQPSWRLRSTSVEAWLTRLGGQLAPVRFRLGKRTIAPYALAPWLGEKLPPGAPPVIQALRGDFFCLPFGAPVKGHPLHGDTANAVWKNPTAAKEDGVLRFRAEIRSRLPAGKVVKEIELRDGHTAVYSRHILSGMSGRTSFATHPMLQFPAEPGSGLIATSPIRFGQVRPGTTEDPTKGGYSSLRPGAVFESLAQVESLDGTPRDLSSYPARLGYEDYVMVANEPIRPFAWTAVTFPGQRYVWFVLKDPRVLPSTFFWFSNAGLHSAPALGRLRGVLGIEDIAGYFGDGPGPLSRATPFRGHPAHAKLDPKRPLSVATISGVAAIPAGFGRVDAIDAEASGIVIASGRHRVRCPLHHRFLDPLS